MEKLTKKTLQKEILKAYKNGERILDVLLEFQRIYGLDEEETKRLVSKSIKDKMFQQEKLNKTVVSRRTRPLVGKKSVKTTKFDLDEDEDF